MSRPEVAPPAPKPASLPAGSGYYDGSCFWLNEVAGEEVQDPEDPRLTEDERSELDSAGRDLKTIGQLGQSVPIFELCCGDERCAVPPSANRGTHSLAALNHDPASLRSALLTTFDLVGDVPWMQKELRLPRSVELTLCTHPWSKLEEERHRMVSDLSKLFEDAVVHFPGHQSQPAFAGDTAWESAVHAKLMLLEFADRLRVVVTTANLRREHWSFCGEALWVQDFPCRARAEGRVPDGGCNEPAEASAFFSAATSTLGRDFACSLAHFVSHLLRGAASDRRSSWITRLSCFDFSAAAVQLVLTLPGCYQHAPDPPANGLNLRLLATWDDVTESLAQEEPSDDAAGGADVATALPVSRGELRRVGDDSWEVLWGTNRWLLDAESASALKAGEAVGYSAACEVDIIPWDEWTGNECSNQDSASHSGQSGDEAAEGGSSMDDWTDVGQTDSTAAADPASPSTQACRIGVRVTLVGDSIGGWAPGMPSLVAAIELDYGLFALERILGREVWCYSEEKQYAAITGSLSWPDEEWLDDFDHCVGCACPDGAPGPWLVVPGGDARIDAAYAEFANRGRLASHDPPPQAPGRERVRNHSKIIVREFEDAKRGTPYGWVYVGSHNFTKAAWGQLYGEFRDHISLLNRELGVLFVEPRQSLEEAQEAVEGRPGVAQTFTLPFGLPLHPTDVEGRWVVNSMLDDESSSADVQPADDPWEQWQYWNGGWNQGWWGGWSWGTWDGSGSSSTWSDEDLEEDWRLRRSSWWWWT